jgi:hypothetical protein
MVPDLLFGSRVQAMLQAAGHEVDLIGVGAPAPGYDLLVIDLTADDVDPGAVAASGVPTLGFYAHVEPAVRDHAVAAGVDLVVPRSRMNREGAALVDTLLSRH